MSIFEDGQIVDTVDVPPDIFANPGLKMDWARGVLGEKVSKFHGRRYLKAADSPMWNSRGKVTGIKIIIGGDSKTTVYMVVEPDKSNSQGKRIIHIFKEVKDLKKGDARDYIDWKDDSRGREQEEVSMNPLAQALQGLKERMGDLPERHGEVLTLEVGVNFKTGEDILKPVYRKKDPFTYEKPSLTFFSPLNKNFKVDPERRSYRFRVEKRVMTKKITKGGHIIVQCLGHVL
jgi:hypothetical protein